MTARRPLLLLAAAVAVASVVGLVLARRGSGLTVGEGRPEVSVVLPSPVQVPQDWQSPAWSSLLGHEEWRDGDLAALVAAMPSDVTDPDGARRAATGAAVAQLTSDPARRAGFEAYLDDPFGGTSTSTDALQRFRGRCADVEVAGAAPARLPSPGEVAKVLVVWGGDCVDGLSREVLAGRPRDPTTFQASWVYLRRDNGSWAPVRGTALPGSAAGAQDTGATTPSYLLAGLRCGASPLQGRARVEVVEAFSSMCDQAAADGVALAVAGGLRTLDEQRAVAGRSRAEAVPDRCTSRHCAGWAVDVAGDQARRWLSATVGCQSPSGVTDSAGPCPAGTTTVDRALSYGFAAPYRDDPGHLEYVLPPLEQRWTASCTPPAWASAPEALASVWRCRLGRAGLSREEVRVQVARALVVARCESGLNPSLARRDGAATAVGLFQLPADVVRQRTGGRAADPVANSDAAARLFLAARSSGNGFSRWRCGAQLPADGGALPAWAYRW